MVAEPIKFESYFNRLIDKDNDGPVLPHVDYWTLGKLSQDSEAARAIPLGIARLIENSGAHIVAKFYDPDRDQCIFASAVTFLTAHLPYISVGMEGNEPIHYQGARQAIASSLSKIAGPLKIITYVDTTRTGGTLEAVEKMLVNLVAEYGREVDVSHACLFDEAVPYEDNQWQAESRLGDLSVLARFDGNKFIFSPTAPLIPKTEISAPRLAFAAALSSFPNAPDENDTTGAAEIIEDDTAQGTPSQAQNIDDDGAKSHQGSSRSNRNRITGEDDPDNGLLEHLHRQARPFAPGTENLRFVKTRFENGRFAPR